MLPRSDALVDISAWSTEEVLCLLHKNGLEKCCKAVAKRQIDGDELLHLTDGKLALWKNDLTRPLIGQLWAFVQELNKTPEKYLLEKTTNFQQNDDHLSDSGSWGTDFEDEIDENSHIEKDLIKPNLISNNQIFSQNNKDVNRTRVPNNIIKSENEETYANCEPCQNEENMYANFQKTETLPPRNISRLHSQVEKSSLKDERKRINDQSKKPTISPKPEILSFRETQTTSEKRLPQKSFLHNVPRVNRVLNETQKKMFVPPPPDPKRNKERIEKFDKELPKPPATIRNLDLVANLPAQTEESEDEYETFDENIIEHNKKKEISRIESKQSLYNDLQESVESIYKPSSTISHEEEEDYEMYESITETPEESDYYLRPIQRTNDMTEPPPLPAKQSSISPSSTLQNKVKSKKPTERSPDKKSTLPHTSSNNPLLTERATRPLPPPPEKQSYMDKPWFHNVTREQATILIKEQGTYSNPQDGYFLLRLSTTHVGKPLILVLWYKDRVYNIPIRKRSDNRYALGSEKMNEQSFSSIEEIVSFYKREELVLQTDGMHTGSTKLTDTPPK